MKSFVRLVSVIFLGIAVKPAFAWYQRSCIETGWYYGYDNQEGEPPIKYPELPPLPTYVSIHDHPDAIEHEPYCDRPCPYAIEDSFWYYGYWYVPGDTLYISPDGWISFDPACTTGFPYPPSTDAGACPSPADPNALIAPLWQDDEPCSGLHPPGENRVHHLYDPEDKILSVEWYKVHGAATDNIFTYMATLQMGGQELLIKDCDVFFSGHLIHFLYDTADDWLSENGGSGIEDLEGNTGIAHHDPDDPEVTDGTVARFGYRRTLEHDVAAVEIITPETVLEPGVDIEPRGRVVNVGRESEVYNVVYNIYDPDEEPSLIYHEVTAGFFQLENSYPEVIAFPYWTPGDSGKHYIAELIAYLDNDECRSNDTLIKHFFSGAGASEKKPLAGFELRIIDIQTIEFTVLHRTEVKLAVYDVNGRKVRTLAERVCSPGTHTLSWDGTDGEGRELSKGVYLVRIEADGWNDVEKVIMVK